MTTPDEKMRELLGTAGPQVGDTVYFDNFDNTQNKATVTERRETDGYLKVDWEDGFVDTVDTEWYSPDEFVKEATE